MLDGALRPLIDPFADRAAAFAIRRGWSANAITIAAFGIGAAGGLAIYAGAMRTGLLFLLASRFADAVDGAVARRTKPTDFGGYLDIVLDFTFYGLVPLAFILHDPQANGLTGGLLLFAFYVNGASFLAYAAIAAKRGLEGEMRGKKSIYFTTGLAEAFETYLVFATFCLRPAMFPAVATIFAVICLYTALARIIGASAAFED